MTALHPAMLISGSLSSHSFQFASGERNDGGEGAWACTTAARHNPGSTANAPALESTSGQRVNHDAVGRDDRDVLLAAPALICDRIGIASALELRHPQFFAR